MAESLIQIEHLKKRFGKTVLYDDLNLSVYKGEVLTIMGGSGSGKSVLLKLMLGLVAPTEGRILFSGKSINDLGAPELRELRKKIGMVFQGAALFDSLTVYENVAYPIREHFDYPEEKIAEIVAHKLELVGLPGIEKKMPSELSGGMTRRVGLARAIAIDPEVIFYDEPTAGLDPSNTNRIGKLIMSLQKHLTVTSVLVTHDMESAFAVSDRIAILLNKKIYYLGTVEEVKSSSNEKVQDFIHGNLET